MSDNGIDRLVTWDEFEQVNVEQVQNIVDLQTAFNTLKDVVNTQAEVIGMCRYILSKFVPQPMFTQAVKEYRAERERQILTETVPTANA